MTPRPARFGIALPVCLLGLIGTPHGVVLAQESAPATAGVVVVDKAAPTEPFADIARDAPAWRREIRHEELAARLQQFLDATPAEAAEAQADIQAARSLLAELAIERAALAHAGAPTELRALPPATVGERFLAADPTAVEATAIARWLFRAGATAAAEEAVGRARDLDQGQRAVGDQLLAESRGEGVPKGGYHRYRGEFLPLAVRDRARLVDDTLQALADLGLEGAEPPFEPQREVTNLPAFEVQRDQVLGKLRAAAMTIRGALRPDYDEVRGWLTSYSSSRSLREQLIAAHGAMAKPRDELLKLIGRYDKPEQPQVDAGRAALEEQYAAYEELVDRDRRSYDRVSPASAYTLLQRVRGRELVLNRIDALLRAERVEVLGDFVRERPDDAATNAKRLLPGREQSGLEDALWLLAHLRAGQVRDVLERGADLQRQHQELTPWENWLVEELLAEAVDVYNAQAAFSLDETEWQFVAVLNRYRRVLGLRPFEVEERLNAASRKHSQEMIDLGYFGHISPVPRNRGPSDRVRLEGFGGGVGENCLGGRVDGRGAFEGWYHSPGHHRGLVSRSPQTGVGAAGGHSMWTMVMGGTDLGWRSLHDDVAPAERETCGELALELARASGAADPSARERARLEQAGAAVEEHLPQVLPAVARLAFAAAKDERSPHHDASAGLLRRIVAADLPVNWRPLQVAAVAASIDLMRFGRSSELRQQAFDTVRPLVESDFDYRADGLEAERRDPVLRLRAHWEDQAQWNFRRSGPAPVAKTVPGREGSGDGPSQKAKLKVLAKPERLRMARQNGGGTDTERAIDRALEFLARVQDEDGAWRARAFLLHLSDVDPRTAGLGSEEWDVAMTGLSILAYVTSGHTTEQGDYTEQVQRAVRWLGARVADYGRFETTSGHYMYSHAIATQALCEVHAYTDDPYVAEVAQLALDFLVFAQDRNGGGWRYDPKQAGDTSVVGWVVMALNAGHKAGLDVVGYRDALRFIDAMTEPGYYQVGYTGRPGLANENLRLTSVGMVSRMFLGQSPEIPQVRLPSWRLVEHLPQVRGADFYYWYYATLALFQVGGEHWGTWNKALKPAMLELQDDDRRSPFYGSWHTTGGFDGRGGRIYSTAIGVLILTTYYRYDRAPKIKVHPFTGNLREVAAPFLERLRNSKDAQERAIVLARLTDELGPSLVPVICDVLEDEKEDKDLRRQMATLLVTVCQERHEHMLLPLLGLKDGPCATQVARALASIASERSVKALEGALNHGDRNVRIFAARALGRLGVQESTKALSERLQKERDGGAKNAIGQALQALASRDELAVLVDAAVPAGEPGRLGVFENLEHLQASGITKILLAAREGEPKLWRESVDAVKKHRDRALVPVLMKLLESENEATREVAIKHLGAITRHAHGFDPKAGARERKEALRRWERWWEEMGEGY